VWLVGSETPGEKDGEMAFKVDDVVQLKSGGPLMTVTDPGRTVDGKVVVRCAWYDERKPCSNVFPADALKIVEKPGARTVAARLARSASPRVV
jgi:uncharacterized protein YodC (DUF2158 family)